MTTISMARMMSSLVNCSAEPAGGLGDRHGRRLGEAQIDDLDLVAALLVEADRRAHQSRDLVDLLLAARLVDDVALVVLAVGAVDQDGDRDAIDAAALDHFGLGRLRYFVIDDLLGFLALVARIARTRRRRSLPLVSAGYLVADRDLVVADFGSPKFLPASGSSAPRGPRDRICPKSAVMRLKSKSALTWMRARPGPTTDVTIASTWSRSRFSNDDRRSSTLTSPTSSSPAAVGKEAPGFVDDRHPLRLEPVDGGGDQVADGAHLLRLQRAVDFEHDRRRRLHFVARESGRSGSTRCTRAATTRSRPRMVRASSPSSARRLLMFCTKLVVPSASDLSKIS